MIWKDGTVAGKFSRSCGAQHSTPGRQPSWTKVRSLDIRETNLCPVKSFCLPHDVKVLLVLTTVTACGASSFAEGEGRKVNSSCFQLHIPRSQGPKLAHGLSLLVSRAVELSSCSSLPKCHERSLNAHLGQTRGTSGSDAQAYRIAGVRSLETLVAFARSAVPMQPVPPSGASQDRTRIHTFLSSPGSASSQAGQAGRLAAGRLASCQSLHHPRPARPIRGTPLPHPGPSPPVQAPSKSRRAKVVPRPPLLAPRPRCSQVLPDAPRPKAAGMRPPLSASTAAHRDPTSVPAQARSAISSRPWSGAAALD